MTKLERLERDIESLSPEEAAEFRAWFLEYDWRIWDRRFERDVKAGKLDALARDAVQDYDAGRTSEL
ncbi:MAG: hypothetical protein WDA27_13625 [Actinomycetota bacterium]